MEHRFRVVIPSDFLDERGEVGARDIGLALLDQAADILEYRFLMDDPRVVSPEQIAEADGLILLAGYVTRDTFSRGARNLTIIARFGVGYDHVDLRAATENDVALFNAAEASPHSLASAALAFMLALAKGLWRKHAFVTAGQWANLINYGLLGDEIQGRTLGIIGLGRSGQELVRLVQPFGMRVLAYTRSPGDKALFAQEHHVQLVPLDQLLQESDFVSIHCPLTEETKGLLGAREFGLMKRNAYLINVSRGSIVDQQTLVRALIERRLAGAGLDVFAVEPIPRGDSILGLDNALLSPHLLASTQDTWTEYGRWVSTGLIAAAAGKVPANVVNSEVLERAGFRAKLARFSR